MKFNLKYIFLILLLMPALAFFISAQKAEPTAYELVRKMFTKARQIQTLKYNLVKRERIKGKMVEEKAAIKLHRSPFKVYIRQEYPKSGLEVLYINGGNDNKALINTNSFPFVTISLDPMSGTMREDQHHTLLNAGFDYVVNTIEFLLDKYESSAAKMVKDAGDINWNNRACHKIIMENPNFRYIDYQLKKGENVLTIANKYKVSEYMIVEINKKVKDYYDVKPGQVIRIPNDYAPKMVIFLDKQYLLPILMQIYDEKGVYEQYEYQNLQLNPNISPAEFTRDYKGYKF